MCEKKTRRLINIILLLLCTLKKEKTVETRTHTHTHTHTTKLLIYMITHICGHKIHTRKK